MRNDGSVCSEVFEITQGLRQGCMLLSPLLFNVALTSLRCYSSHQSDSAIQRGREDADIILANLANAIFTSRVPVKEDGLETALEYARRAIWGMLYADDVCIVSPSPHAGWSGLWAVFVKSSALLV